MKSHKDQNVWNDADLIRVIQRNWPESIADKEVSNVQWEPHLRDEEIGTLRRKGYSFGVNVGGKAYLLLGHGQLTSGNNIMAARMADEVWRWVGENIKMFETDLLVFKKALLDQLHM